jgi:hypothetical protein
MPVWYLKSLSSKSKRQKLKKGRFISGLFLDSEVLNKS